MWLKVKEQKNIHHANISQKKAGIAASISDKVDFRAKKIITERHYTMLRRSINQQNIAILNVNVPNNTTVKYIKQKLVKLKGKIDNSTSKLQTFTPFE